jgi:hypothetical protein
MESKEQKMYKRAFYAVAGIFSLLCLAGPVIGVYEGMHYRGEIREMQQEKEQIRKEAEDILEQLNKKQIRELYEV